MDPVIDGDAMKATTTDVFLSARERWLAERRTAITATDAGAILGVSKFATPLDVFLEKTGQAVEVVQTERMEAGNRMQRPIIDWWADRKGVEIVHEQPWYFRRSAKETIIGASLDAYRKEDGAPIDAKNISWRKAEWGEEDTDKIPLQYAVQLAVQMYVTDTFDAFLPVLFGGNELVGYRMHRDLALERSIVERCLAFHHEHVLTGIAPAVDGSASWDDYLKRKFATNTEVMLRGTPELEQTAAAFTVALQQVQAAEMEAERLKNIFKLAIGENAGIETSRWKATWKRTKDSVGTDFEQTARDLALALAARTGEPAVKILAEATAKNEKVTKQETRRFLFTHRSA